MEQKLPTYQTESWQLSNMFSRSCIKLVRLSLMGLEGVQEVQVDLGKVSCTYQKELCGAPEILSVLDELGFYEIRDADAQLVDRVKIAATELIFYANNANSLIRNSDYISERLQVSYEKISKTFSRVTGITYEKYLIRLKIEKVKELLIRNDHSLGEISYMLGYSSVQYLSNQFRKEVGVTITAFRKEPYKYRIPLEELCS